MERILALKSDDLLKMSWEYNGETVVALYRVVTAYQLIGELVLEPLYPWHKALLVEQEMKTLTYFVSQIRHWLNTNNIEILEPTEAERILYGSA